MKTTLLLTALVSASALAQEAAPPPPPPAPAATADAPVATETDPGGRVRWGIGVGAGMHFGIPYPVFGMQLKGRVGYQISNLLGVYLDLGSDFGVGGQASVSAMGASASATGLGHVFVQALAEIMLGDLFYIGGGGGFAYGGLGVAGVDASTSGGGVSAIAAGGIMPAFDVKLGLGFGKAKPGSWRRGGFNLGIDAQMVLHTGAVVTRVQADMNGGQVAVNTNEAVFTVTPMLTLGYDAR